MGASKKIGIALALMSISVVVSLIFFEIGLRLAGISYPSFYDLDLHRGNALHPNAEGWNRKEGEAYVRINSDGLRDREHEIEKPAGTFRIAVLGDSYTEAFQVPQEAAFWSVLEEKLSSCPAFEGRTVEVINFGVSGYGTTQEYLTLKHHGWDYSPDLVLVAFYTGNDVRNNSRILENSPYRPYFVLEGEKLVLDNGFLELADFAPDRVTWIRKRNDIVNASHTLQLFRTAYSLFKNRTADTKVAVGEESGLNYDVYKFPNDKNWTDAWRVTEEVLRLMHREVKDRGAELWLVTLTSGIQVHPDNALRRQVMNRLGVSNMTYPDERLEQFTKREDIFGINLVRKFTQYVDETKEFLHGFDGKGTGHWNKTGHRLGGEIMAKQICASRTLIAHKSPPNQR